MGTYTELILGAELKSNTPESVIANLKFLFGQTEDKPDDFPLTGDRSEWMFGSASYYFAVCQPQKELFNDQGWRLSARFNVKNYDNEIEEFLDWIKPWIRSGSGNREMYAIVMHEESEEPIIYYLEE